FPGAIMDFDKGDKFHFARTQRGTRGADRDPKLTSAHRSASTPCAGEWLPGRWQVDDSNSPVARFTHKFRAPEQPAPPHAATDDERVAGARPHRLFTGRLHRQTRRRPVLAATAPPRPKRELATHRTAHQETKRDQSRDHAGPAIGKER